ncbi:MAG TPA: hypothetical protein VNQ34_04005 [Xanthobacteraceae bacterium]|jgi:hypothetical protein|nr:hypothetical protein [Xanthobacteraceae bacterium]
MNESTAQADFEYRFRQRPVGGGTILRLLPDAFEIEIEPAGRKTQVRYSDVSRVRLGFRPANLAGQRYLAEVWSRTGGKLSIPSVSARGMFHFDNQAAAYRAFITELCRRIGEAQPSLQIDAGMPAWRWWPGAVFGGAVLLAILYFSVAAIRDGNFSLLVVTLIFAALFLSQVGALLLRNRPRKARMNLIPAQVLPPA